MALIFGSFKLYDDELSEFGFSYGLITYLFSSIFDKRAFLASSSVSKINKALLSSIQLILNFPLRSSKISRRLWVLYEVGKS